MKIGLMTGFGSILMVSVLQLTVWNWSWIGTLAAGLAAAGLAYAATMYHANRRLEYVRSALKHIRKNSFEHLDLAAYPNGDELNDLIRQVRRTGQVVSQEFNELKKLEHYRRDFIGNVSHELKTPIFAIRGFAETLLEGAIDDESVREEFVRKIIRNADRLSNLTSDLSEISRLETGQKAMTIQPFNPARLIADVVDTVESLADASDIRLSTSLEEHLPLAMGDALQLRQVLTNLVVNAVKYSNSGQTVTIKATSISPEAIEISVHDSGIGIDPKHIDRLTERFFRVDKSRSRLGGGSGLGLAIVKHILAAHGTVLHVDSVPGKGSVFRFELPRAPKESPGS